MDKNSSATGINDIDQLVNTSISAEQHNFKLFNQLNKLSNDLERVEEQILATLKGIQLLNDRTDGAQRTKSMAMTRKSGVAIMDAMKALGVPALGRIPGRSWHSIRGCVW